MENSGQRVSAHDGAAGAAVVVLGISNVVSNRCLPPAAYVPWNLAMAAGLIWIARSSGVHASELGADPPNFRRGLQIGGAGAGAIGATYGMLLLTGAGADAFRDERVTSVGTTATLWHLLVRIPFGTVLAEEVAFRGVLPALLSSSRRPAWLPGAVASLLFGLWHVLPSRDLCRANEAMGRIVGPTGSQAAAALSVAVTAVAGGVLHVLRQRAGHLVAPVAVHLATNVLGFLGARLMGTKR